MIALALVLSIFGAIALLITSVGRIASTTPVDRESRGRWGVLDITRTRRRRLDPEERRWETWLVAARSHEHRWMDLVKKISAMERAVDLEPDPSPPDEWDPTWVATHLTRLERERLERA